MRKAIPTIALAGLTTTVTAQNIATVVATASSSTVGVGETVTISVVLSDNIPGNSVFAFNLEILGAGPLGVTLHDLEQDAGVFGFSGGIDGNNVTGLGGSSDILGPTLDFALDGVTVFRYQVTVTDDLGRIDFTPTLGAGPNPAVQWGLEGGVVILPQDYDEIIFHGTYVQVVPTPSSLIPLALAAPLALRRRR